MLDELVMTAGAICMGLVLGVLLAQRAPAGWAWPPWRGWLAAALAVVGAGGLTAWVSGLAAAAALLCAALFSRVVRAVAEQSLLETTKNHGGRS